MICISKRSNQRGVSLLELTVAIGIGGLITILLVGAAKYLSKSQNNLIVALNEETQAMIGDFFVTNDLLRAGHSFNNLGPCRTVASQPRGFYDYDPMALGCDGATPPAACAPRVKLTVGAGENVSANEVIFLVTSKILPDSAGNASSAMRTIRPTQIYDMAGAGAGESSLTTTGTLDYGDGSELREKLTQYGMFNNGSLLRFYSPYQGRRMLAGGNDFDYAIPPRNISVMGFVSGGALSTDPPPFMQCQASYDYDSIVNFMPNTPVGAFPRIDSFFRLLPARSGRDAFAMVVDVKARRYKLYRAERGKNPFVLMASDWSPTAACPTNATNCDVGVCAAGVNCYPGTWVNRRPVFSGISSNFEFSRKSNRVPSFEYAADVP